MCYRAQFSTSSPISSSSTTSKKMSIQTKFPEDCLATFPDDCLPPECVYTSREALFASINIWAATRGYAFTTGKSRRTTSGMQRVTYACDRCCRPPDPSRERQRNTTTRGTGCQFSVLAKESSDKIFWSLQHRSECFSSHNHPPSARPSAHPMHRRLSKEDKAMVLQRFGISL